MRCCSVLLLALWLAAPAADAGNGSNYVHLTNGLDYFFNKTPPAGKFTGIWRCFPGDMLHAPTLALTGTQAGKYATKVCAIHMVLTASAGSTIDFPTIALSSSTGSCRFLTSAGSLNFAVFSASGFGSFVAGPLTGNGGPVSQVNLLGGVANFSIQNPAACGPCIITFITLNVVGALGQSIGVPDGESLVLWIQDDPNQFGVGTMQYWSGSFDERNLCSGYSFLLSGTGAASSFNAGIEWAIGFGTRDATLTTAINSLGPGPSSLNAHDPINGFNPGFDAGSGTRTISITGTGPAGVSSANIGSEFLAFNVYDESGPSNRLAVANVSGFDPSATATGTCSNRTSTFVKLPTGGPGGPVLHQGGVTMPRSVGRLDALSNVLLANPTWIASTNHATIPGGNNIPYFPNFAMNGGSNAGGNVGGFALPIPPLPPLPGVELFLWSFNIDPSNSFLDPLADDGHKLTNGYAVLLFP